MKELSYKEVENILANLEDRGLVVKTWDIEKNDYVWHQTEIGRKMAKELLSDIE